MNIFGTFEGYEGDVYYAFNNDQQGGVRLQLGPGGQSANFQVTVPKYDGASNVERSRLPEELAISATAKAVFEQAYLAGHLKRDGSKNNQSQFPDTPASVRLEKPIWSLGPHRAHGVRARRITA